MAAGDLALNILINANSSSASSVIGNLGKSLSMLASNPMAAIGVGAAAAGAAVIGFGVASVKAAGDFQQMTTVLVTSAGESASQLDMVRQGILNMAVATGTSTENLAHGMYMIESAGFHGAAGLQVLGAAAMGAKAENADLYTVGNALTTMLTDYHMSAGQATQAMNGLIATVASGKTNLQNLASSMGSVLPLASSLGIAFPQVAGAIATMTNSGMSAQRASMNLANAIRNLAAPSGIARSAMKGVGLSAQEVSNVLTHQGLQQALQMIEDQVGKKFPAGSAQWTAAMKSIMGGATGLNVALMLGGKNMAGYGQRIKDITAAMSPAQKGIMGWSETQSNFNFKMDQAKQALNVLMITLGTKLLPVLGQLAAATVPLILGFANLITTGGAVTAFFQKNQLAGDALIAVLVGIGAGILVFAATAIPALVAGFIAWAAAAWAAAAATLIAAAPFILIGVIVAIVVLGIILAIQHWGQISAWLQGVWNAVLNWFKSAWQATATWFMSMLGSIGTFFKNVWNGIINFFKGIWNNIVNTVKTGINTVVGWFSWLYNHNYYFKMLVDFIRNVITTIITWLVSRWQTTVNTIGQLWNTMIKLATTAWNGVKGIFSAVWGWMSGIFSTIWSNIVSWWNTAVSACRTFADNVWTGVQTVFNTAWGMISGPLNSLWSSLSGWFSNLASTAVTWGTNIIQGFINGINNMLGAVGNAAQNVVSTVASFLGFHSPAKEGPGRYIVQWGEGMVKGFALGMQNAMPLVHGQINHMISAPNVAYAGASAGNAFALHAPSSSSNHPQTVNMQIMLDGKEITNVVGARMSKEMRLQGTVRNR